MPYEKYVQEKFMETNAVEVISVIVYLIGMVVIGIILAKRVKNNSDEYMAGGRNLPFWLVTATLFATWWGGGTVLGGSGAAYHGGFQAVIYDPFGAGLTLILSGLFMMKIVHDAKVNTLAQFFSCRYGKSASRVSAIVMIPTYALFAAVQLVAIGKIFEFVLGWNYTFSIVIGALIIVAYTILGGILAVAWTDFFQIIIVLLGLLIMFPLAVKSAGGWGAVKAATPPEFFDIFMSKGASISDHLWWWGALLGVGLGTMAGPDLYQRAIIAKTGKTAAAASVTSGVGYWLLGTIPVFLGFVGITLVSQGVLNADVVDEDSEQLILLLARLVLHPAVAGVFIASLLAAVMSTADSAIFATAAVMGNDIVKPIYEKTKGKELDDKGLIKVTRYSIVGFTLIAFFIGLNFPVMYDLLIIGFQLLFHMLFFPLILGVYWKKANTTGSSWGMGTGFVIAMIWLISSGSFYPEPEWLWTLGPGIASGAVMVIVSLITQKKDPARPLMSTDGRIMKFAELAEK